METIMCFWLTYFDRSNHIKSMARELLESDKVHAFLLSGGTPIDESECLESLENAIQVMTCTEEQMQKLSIYFDIKIYLHFKNISYDVNIDYVI